MLFMSRPGEESCADMSNAIIATPVLRPVQAASLVTPWGTWPVGT